MSREPGRPSRLRAALVLVAVVTAAAGVLTVVGPDLVDAAAALTGGAPRVLAFDQVLVWGAEAVAAGCVAWLSAVAVLVLAPTLRPGARPADHPPGRRGCPWWLHRLLLAACGVGLTAALGSPAYADLAPRAATGGTAGDPSVVAGLPYPDRAPGGRQRAATPPTPRPSSADRTHTVRPGDTLWDIAAAGLGPGAADAAVADRWRLIHRRNADVLGPDPDLIHPGTVLRLPANDLSDPGSPE